MANVFTALAPTLYSAAQEVSAEPFGAVDSINTNFDDKGVAIGDSVIVPVAPTRAAGDYTIEGEQTKRVPAGFDAEHARADLLRYKGLYASSPQFDIQAVTTPDLVDICYEHCRNMAPLQQWLVAVDRG